MKSVHFWTNFELAKGVPPQWRREVAILQGFGIILHQNEIHQQLGTYKCLGEYSFEEKGFELVPLNMASQEHFGWFS